MSLPNLPSYHGSIAENSQSPDPSERRPEPTASLIGQTLDHYEVVEWLGEGAMGIVYKALDQRLERFVAIKTLRSGLAAGEEHKRRFAQEAKSASALNHPSIIHIYDIGKSNDLDFIAMEYVQGKTLDHLIGPEGMRVTDALKYSIQVADALEAAHGAGIVHRDLKPGNIMVTERGLVKVLDFGLAKLTEQLATPNPLRPDETVSYRQITRTIQGALIGTPAYMSPEQAEGITLDGRSDIFSFGLILYQMVTGQMAFAGCSTISVLTQILRDDPKPPSSVSGKVPSELERVILRCLRKDPNRRYQHISEVRIALEDLRTESASGTSISLTAPTSRLARSWSRRNVLAFAALAAVILLGALAWRWYTSRNGAKTPASEPVLSRLTSDPGLSTDPAISRDGKLVAYASDRAGNGNLDIWVRQIGGGQPLQLTSDAADDSEPDFAPDGTRIVFHSDRDGGGIYSVSALGGTEQRIADRGRRPRFSPDGDQIAYWVGGLAIKTRGIFSRIYVVSSSGGTPREILPEFTARWPVWSPDGKYLLFMGTKTPAVLASYAWWIAPLNGGAPRRTFIPVNPMNEAREPVIWRGDQIVYAWRGQDSSAGLKQISFSPSSGNVSGEPRRLTFGTATESHPSSTADGRMLFASLEVTRGIYTLALGGDTSQQEPMPISKDLSHNESPSISTSGKELVFSKASSGAAEVWLRDLETGKEKALINSGHSEGLWPRISPDGTKVVYRETVGDKNLLMELPTSGGVPRQVCVNCGSVGAWFPDGSRLLVADYSKQTTIDVLDLASGQKVEYLKHPKYSLFPRAVSPDGRWIAFTADVGGGRTPTFISAYRPAQPPGEKDWIQVTDGAASDGMPLWSADGSLLYFISERDGAVCLWAQRLNPASQRPVGEAYAVHHFHGAALRLNRSTAVARDKIVVELQRQTGNIWMLDPGKPSAPAK